MLLAIRSHFSLGQLAGLSCSLLALISLSASDATAQTSDPPADPATMAPSAAVPAEPATTPPPAAAPAEPATTPPPAAAPPSPRFAAEILQVADPPAPARPAFILRGFLGAGFAGYQERGTQEQKNHLFAEGAGAISAGYFAVRKPAGSLAVSVEALVARSLESSVGARAAGNFAAVGLVLTAHFNRIEVGLGGYLVARASEARQLRLTGSDWNGGVGAQIGKSWALGQRWSWGIAAKVLMLPTGSYIGSDGKKHVHFSDGTGMLGVLAGWQ